MNHLESAFVGKNSFWRYLLMILVVLLVSNLIGGLPLLIAYGIKAAGNPEIISALSADPSNIGVLGLNPNLGLILMIIPSIAGLVAFFLLIKPFNERTIVQTINGTGSVRWKRFFISALVWSLLSALYMIVYFKYDPSNFNINNNTFSLIYLAVISMLFIPFQALFEEVLFRGYLMQGFAVMVRNRWFPLLMTSVLFGLMHAPNPEVKNFGFFTMMPLYIMFGIVFGITAIMDDGIEVAMGAHTANNIFTCIFLTNSSSVLQTSALYEQKQIYPWREFTGLLIASVIFIFVLKMIFKWEKFSLIWGRISKPADKVQSV
jgi:hypothetical protein